MNHGDDANLVIDIEAMLGEAETSVTDDCCIYRVPFGIRRCNEDAYTPKVVSIGPFHHNSHPPLLNMQRHKLSYCRAFLQRTQTTSDTWIRYIQSVEPNIRRCYSVTLPFTKEELVKIIFVDSGFILELFRRYYDQIVLSDDVCLETPWLDSSIRRDMLLLENQLPFFVLDHLFNISTSAHAHNLDIPFSQLTFYYFDYYNICKLRFDHHISIRHFTDLLRTFHLQDPKPPRIPRYNKIESCLPSVTDLSEAQAARIEVNNESKCLLDLTFSERVLRIPKLEVNNESAMLFYNMVALEQCHYPLDCYITDYVQIMYFLINTTTDVDILIEKGVLINWLGDNKSVANLFNGLCLEIVQINCNQTYFDLAQHWEDFRRLPWNRYRSMMRREYFLNTGVFVSLLALYLAIAQTIVSILQLK
ncbi:hypothetical protein Fmac_000746 [Flemingia macrophylla]|uniref:Uncharacterized protein n=1 Tax=Flemingia macrophylla TaxID=520843 RepID=A0ABD1NF93_9FABA